MQVDCFLTITSAGGWLTATVRVQSMTVQCMLLMAALGEQLSPQLCCDTQTASTHRLTALSFSDGSSASRWTATYLCGTNPSRCVQTALDRYKSGRSDPYEIYHSLTIVSGKQDGAELQAAIISRLPAKIDVGPVYNVDPKRRAAYASGASSCSRA